MGKLKVTQIKSRIGSNKKQKATLDALGLNKMNKSVEHEDCPVIKGMINKVSHLVNVEEL